MRNRPGSSGRRNRFHPRRSRGVARHPCLAKGYEPFGGNGKGASSNAANAKTPVVSADTNRGFCVFLGRCLGLADLPDDGRASAHARNRIISVEIAGERYRPALPRACTTARQALFAKPVVAMSWAVNHRFDLFVSTPRRRAPGFRGSVVYAIAWIFQAEYPNILDCAIVRR